MGLADPNALVTVKMKGLGLAFLNRDVWEFLFLRGIDCHELRVIVREFRADLEKPIETVYPIPNAVRRLNIATKNPSTTGSRFLSNNRQFDFDYHQDNWIDARWLTDLSELYGSLDNPKSVKLKKTYPFRNLTFLSISNGVFHTLELSRDTYGFRQRGAEIKRRNVGLWLGLDIGWQAPDSETEIEMQIANHRLAHKPNLLRYEIEFNNDCDNTSGELDFKHYFSELIAEPNGDEVSQTHDAKSGRIDCHLVQVSHMEREDGTDLSTLLDLM